jgi:hypothetical protein
LPALSINAMRFNGAARAMVQLPEIAFLSPFSMQRDAASAKRTRHCQR